MHAKNSKLAQECLHPLMVAHRKDKSPEDFLVGTKMVSAPYLQFRASRTKEPLDSLNYLFVYCIDQKQLFIQSMFYGTSTVSDSFCLQI